MRYSRCNSYEKGWVWTDKEPKISKTEITEECSILLRLYGSAGTWPWQEDEEMDMSRQHSYKLVRELFPELFEKGHG